MRLLAIKTIAMFFVMAVYWLPLPLDEDIRKMVQVVIESDLAAPKVPKERVPKLKRVWKCDSAYDFLYGDRTGYYKGLAEGFMLERHKRQLSDAETDEIYEIILQHAGRMRRYFAYYKRKSS
jgi:hypothetical protein